MDNIFDGNEYFVPSETEFKYCQLQIIKAVRDTCIKHGIRYFLAYGSLIGCVRHQGFIPWDDDIDIIMMREDYKRFIMLFNLENTRYRVKDQSIDENFPYFHAKIYDSDTIWYEIIDKKRVNTGIGIDLFPLDNLPNSKFARLNVRLYAKICNIMLLPKVVVENKERGILKRVMIKILGQITHKKSAAQIYICLRKVVIKYSQYDSQYVWCAISPYDNDIHPISDYQKSILGNFEGDLFSIPQNYDAILRRIYGHYMKLPPEEERKSHHDYIAFVKKVKN